MKPIAPALALLLGASCAVAADSAAALERAAPPRGGNPAVLALLEAAEHEFRAGRPEQASMVLERALRIEPGNPAVWHDLGRASLELGNSAQAEAMAAKSHNLAGDNRALRVSNAELMAAALQSSGRTPTNNQLQVLASPRWFDAAIERASTYSDTGDRPERRYSEEQVRRWAPAQAAAQTSRDVRSPAWRARDAAAEGVRRERAARRAELRSRSVIMIDSRQYRRSGSNEIVRRQR